MSILFHEVCGKFTSYCYIHTAGKHDQNLLLFFFHRAIHVQIFPDSLNVTNPSFSKKNQSEHSYLISSQFYFSELGVSGSFQVFKLLIPTLCTLNLKTEVQFCLYSFYFPDGHPGHRNPQKYRIVMLVSNCIDT